MFWHWVSNMLPLWGNTLKPQQISLIILFSLIRCLKPFLNFIQCISSFYNPVPSQHYLTTDPFRSLTLPENPKACSQQVQLNSKENRSLSLSLFYNHVPHPGQDRTGFSEHKYNSLALPRKQLCSPSEAQGAGSVGLRENWEGNRLCDRETWGMQREKALCLHWEQTWAAYQMGAREKGQTLCLWHL